MTCRNTQRADDPQVLVLYLAMVGCDFEILGPPEVIDAGRVVAARLAR